MDNLRKAEPILTVANTLGLVGITFYFYRAITSLQAQQAKLADALQTTIDTVGEMKAKDNTAEMVKAIKVLDANLLQVKTQLADTANIGELDELRDQMLILMASLKESGIETDDIISQVYQPPPPPPSIMRQPRGQQRQVGRSPAPHIHQQQQQQPALSVSNNGGSQPNQSSRRVSFIEAPQVATLQDVEEEDTNTSRSSGDAISMVRARRRRGQGQ